MKEFKSRARALIFLLLLAGVLAQAIFARKGPAKPAQEVFLQAERLMSERKYEQAVRVYQELIVDHPGSALVSRSQLRIAECYYLNGNELASEDKFRHYIGYYRGEGEDLDRAYKYLMAMSAARSGKIIFVQQSRLLELEAQMSRTEATCARLASSVSVEDVYLELDLDGNRLFIKMGTRVLYDFPVVVGKGKATIELIGKEFDFSTPRGILQVMGREENPVWRRPDWYWLEQGENPPRHLTDEGRAVKGYLGRYRISLGGGVSIHGTQSGRISPGRYSHGCIRMNAPDLEKVWKTAKIGARIYVY